MIGTTNAVGSGTKRAIPQVTYTGQMVTEQDGSNWKLSFLTSGILTFVTANNAEDGIDVFCVGGGAGGRTADSYHGGAGGGGGYTTTQNNAYAPQNGSTYTVVIGAGGTADGDGSASSFTDGNTTVTANGGLKGVGATNSAKVGGAGGSGGGGSSRYDVGGNGGSNGADGSAGSGSDPGSGGTGQGVTTREFNEPTGTLYSGGGAGGNGRGYTTAYATGGVGGGGGSASGTKDGVPNTGGGGGSGNANTDASVAGLGGSGIVIIRNARF